MDNNSFKTQHEEHPLKVHILFPIIVSLVVFFFIKLISFGIEKFITPDPPEYWFNEYKTKSVNNNNYIIYVLSLKNLNKKCLFKYCDIVINLSNPVVTSSLYPEGNIKKTIENTNYVDGKSSFHFVTHQLSNKKDKNTFIFFIASCARIDTQASAIYINATYSEVKDALPAIQINTSVSEIISDPFSSSFLNHYYDDFCSKLAEIK